MTDTISVATLRQVSDSLLNEVPTDTVVHTLVITLNGEHGGVDVTAGMVTTDAEYENKTWAVRL